MESITHSPSKHMGRKVARVRELRGLTQTQLGELLGMTKQAISKLEQGEKINDKRLKEIAQALNVTFEGLKKYRDESVLYYTYNFYENSGVNSASIGANHIDTINYLPFEQALEFFEKLLQVQMTKTAELKKKK